MGSFNFIDFITDLPIVGESNALQLITICQKQTRPILENIHDIDGLYSPVTFPLIGKYINYGKFELTPAFKKQNDLAIDYLDDLQILDDEGYLNSGYLMNNDLIICATSYNLYKNAINTLDMHNKPAHYTERDQLEDAITEGKRFKDATKDERCYILDTPFISSPQGKIKGRTTRSLTKQLLLYNSLDTDDSKQIFNYILDWTCFYQYLSMISKPFKSVVHTSQSIDDQLFDLLSIQNRLQTAELNQLKNELIEYENEDDLSDTLSFDEVLNYLYKLEQLTHNESSEELNQHLHYLRKTLEKNGMQ